MNNHHGGVFAVLAGIAVIAIVIGMAASCASVSGAKGKSAVLVIPAKEVQDMELTMTKQALEEAGVKVTIAAPTLNPVNGMLGGSFTPDIDIASIDPAKYDLIACIGGMGIFDIWADPVYIEKVQAFHAKGKYVTAICGASAVLANAGLLKGVEATCFPYEPIIALLKEKGALYTDKTVVVSGKIITGNGPDASVPFGKALAALF